MNRRMMKELRIVDSYVSTICAILPTRSDLQQRLITLFQLTAFTNYSNKWLYCTCTIFSTSPASFRSTFLVQGGKNTWKGQDRQYKPVPRVSDESHGGTK